MADATAGAGASGVHLDLVLDRDHTSDRLVYRGEVTLADTAPVAIDVVVCRAPSGAAANDRWTASANPAGALDASLMKMAEALTRSAVRSCVVRGQPPPRRVRRWREVPPRS